MPYKSIIRESKETFYEWSLCIIWIYVTAPLIKIAHFVNDKKSQLSLYLWLLILQDTVIY